MKRIGNNKLLITDKELKSLVKEGYNRGAMFGMKANAMKVVNALEIMTPENFELVKEQVMGFCQQTVDIANQNKGKGK